jgi:hypothetical protein
MVGKLVVDDTSDSEILIATSWPVAMKTAASELLCVAMHSRSKGLNKRGRFLTCQPRADPTVWPRCL